MSDFQEKIATAQANGDEWVETSPEIIKVYQPRGMGGAKFFIYQGIKVCEYGQTEAIEEECNTPLYLKIHGPKEAKVVSGA